MTAHTSAILAMTLNWDHQGATAVRPLKVRKYIGREALAWQQLSQHGADAEGYAFPSPWRRQHVVNGKARQVPRRGRRLPEGNRLLELHGLAGGIGEQLGLAWTAEQDVQRLIVTQGRTSRDTEHQRLIQRAVTELAGHFALGASHSLANLVLRLLLLNPNALASLARLYPRAGGFPPGSDTIHAWLTFSPGLITNLTTAAEGAGNPFMADAVVRLAEYHSGVDFQTLSQRRGLDYHRRRPQSVLHVSPRTPLVEHFAEYSQFTMPGPELEPEADADALHQMVVNALEALRVAMRDTRLLMPRAIRREGITYIFGR